MGPMLLSLLLSSCLAVSRVVSCCPSFLSVSAGRCRTCSSFGSVSGFGHPRPSRRRLISFCPHLADPRHHNSSGARTHQALDRTTLRQRRGPLPEGLESSLWHEEVGMSGRKSPPTAIPPPLCHSVWVRGGTEPLLCPRGPALRWARRVNKPLFLRGEPWFFIHPNLFHTLPSGRISFIFRVVLHPGLRSWEEVDQKLASLCCG